MSQDDGPQIVSIDVRITYSAWTPDLATKEALFAMVTELLPGVIPDPEDESVEGASFVKMEEL